MATIKLKYRASVILEPLIALTIISVILTIGVMIFNHLGTNNSAAIKIVAIEKIDSLKLENTFESESFDFGHFTIDKDVSDYPKADDLYLIEWTVMDLRKRTVLEQKEILLKP